MPRLTIDQRPVEVPPGATVLDAARLLGIDVPMLCYRDGCSPSTSCLVCMVKLAGSGKLVPACGTPAEDGMAVESETDEVHQVRRSALELLLSDHLGDCLAPCLFACPAEMDIPKMLRQIAAGDLRGAIATVKADIALPAVLGRICPAPCEKTCRRTTTDGAVAICQLKRFVADADLATPNRYVPPCDAESGKRVAIIGGGPTGLAAAYYLRQRGHSCTLFERENCLGGRLRQESELEAPVLDAEIESIAALELDLRLNAAVTDAESFAEICQEFDAVLVACGAAGQALAPQWGLAASPRGIQVDAKTYATSREGVFAGGCAVRGKAMVVRSVADGKEAALAIGQYLAKQSVTGSRKPFSTRIGRMEAAEVQLMQLDAAQAARQEPDSPAAGYSDREAREQSRRCLHCDCRALTTCKLRIYADAYGADPRRYKSDRRPYTVDRQHAEVLFEPGKCIDCGLCIQIATAAGEAIGLTFVGRGFDVRVAAPLRKSIADALKNVAAACIEACPTAALAWKHDDRADE